VTDEASRRRHHGDDLRGVTRLIIEATRGVTTVVEAMHHTIASGPEILGRPLAVPSRLLTRVVYGGIRGVTTLVGAGIDQIVARLGTILGNSAPGPEREAVLAALGGVLGDYLRETGNPLAIEMRLRRRGAALEIDPAALRAALADAGGKVVVLVHGSCMNDLQWNRRGHDHGAALAGDLGYTPLYLHYNSGLHISTNGQALAELLERLVAAWPVPLDELVILGHSMGGLVARSACHAGDAADHRWRRALRALVCLGSPHHGAPLERGGSWIDLLLGVSRYSAPLARLGQIRSAGVTDLRYGIVVEEQWAGRDRFGPGGDPRSAVPLPGGVACYAIAATTARENAGVLPGDGLVPVSSALGQHGRSALTLDFPAEHQWISHGTNHLDLLARPEVYAKIREWLTRTAR
jgi:pimeloyl-ACP methyl ester carboxylesterase